jgi:hypothetical protein
MSARSRIVATLALVLVAGLAYTARIRHEMIDFLTWRQAAVRALDAEPLYRVEDGHYQFKYFPAFAVVMSPFGAIDAETGKLLWYAILVGLLVAMLRWSVSVLPDRRLRAGVLIGVTTLLMAKFYAHELVLGQTNLLLGGLLVAAVVALARGRPMRASALAGLAVFVKPYALIMGPWLLATHGWRAVAPAALVIAAGWLLPTMVYGWSGNAALAGDWLRTVTDSTTPNLLGNDNVSIASMWAKWLGPGWSATLLSWLTLAGVLALVVAAWRRRRTVPAPDYLECALLMLLIPLISPQGWDYVLLLATPAVVCLVDRWRELSRPWQGTLGLALALMSFTMFDLMGRALYGRFMALAIVSVCALTLAAGLVHIRWRRLA